MSWFALGPALPVARRAGWRATNFLLPPGGYLLLAALVIILAAIIAWLVFVPAVVGTMSGDRLQWAATLGIARWDLFAPFWVVAFLIHVMQWTRMYLQQHN